MYKQYPRYRYARTSAMLAGDTIMDAFFIFVSSLPGQVLYGAIHFGLAVTCYTFGSMDDYNEFATIPVFISKLPYRIVGKVYDVNVFYFAASILILASLANFLYALGWLRLNRSISIDLRYIEFAVTTPLVIILVAMISGILEIWTLTLIGALMSTSMIFSYYQDRDYKANRLSDVVFMQPFWEGFWPYLFAWFPIWITFGFRTYDDADDFIPGFVYGLMISLSVLYTLFYVIQYTFIARAGGLDQEQQLQRQDGAMHFLTFITKLILGGFIIGGIISLDRNLF